MPHLAPESEEMGGERDKSHTPSSNHGETAMQGTYVKINNGLYGTRWLLPTFIRPRSSEGGWFRVRTIEEAAKKSEGMQAISVACGHMRDEVERREGETPEELGKTNYPDRATPNGQPPCTQAPSLAGPDGRG